MEANKDKEEKAIVSETQGHGVEFVRGTNWRAAFQKMDIAGPTGEQQDAIQDDNLRHFYRQ